MIPPWFLRVFTSGPKKFVVTRLSVEQVAMMAPGFQVEATPESMGRSRIYFSSPVDFDRLRALVIVAYEEEVRRRDTSTPDDSAESAA